MMPAAAIGPTIRAARKLRQIPQTSLAKRVGVTSAMISMWETGRKPVTPARRLQLAVALELPADDPLTANVVEVSSDERGFLDAIRHLPESEREALRSLLADSLARSA